MRLITLCCVLIGTIAMSCSLSGAAVPPLPAPHIDPEREEPANTGTAIFAGGCFWCTEGVFEELAGVQAVVSGYCGGRAETATYEAVCSGTTEHAEAIRIDYDPRIITYGALLQVFFSTHDPTQLNRQGPDRGPQYRSAIFVVDDQQRATAQAYMDQLNAGDYFAQPIVTSIEGPCPFHRAEAYHQDYVRRNPDQGYVRVHALPKLEKTRTLFPERLR